MRANFLVALLGCLLAPAVASPTPRSFQTNSSSNTTLSERADVAWEFYYNNNAAQHQANYNQMTSSGYRMISLSVYGQPPNHNYAAVWVERPGPTFAAIHEATSSQYQSFFNSHAPNGYVSTIITVTGPANGPIFAGIMEKNGITNWYQKCGLTYTQYVDELIESGVNGYILKSFTEYGSSADRLFCGIWYHNDAQTLDAVYLDETYSYYQSTFNLKTAAGWHPSYLSVSEDHMISSQFVTTDVGSWAAMHGLTASALEAERSPQEATGRYIIHLQGGGTGSNINFAVIWAEHDIPI